MRSLTLFLILTMIPLLSSAQQIFYSPITQTWPTIFTTNYQEIDRVISLEENAVVISTETKNGKEFETFFIEEIIDSGNSLSFKCRTAGGENLLVAIPNLKNITFIDLYRRSQNTGEEEQWRLHLGSF